jgi:microcystin-dependent protein
MAEPFLGQIVLYACNFAPRGYALCAGQLLSIAQNTALFSLIGTYYGGNGTTTFALPDLQGRVPISSGQGIGLSDYALGEQGGVDVVTIDNSTLASHNHSFNASLNTATVTASSGNTLGKAQSGNPIHGLTKGLMYSPNAPQTQMSPQALTPVGSGGPHNNLQPYLTLNYCIALQGIYPPRS